MSAGVGSYAIQFGLNSQGFVAGAQSATTEGEKLAASLQHQVNQFTVVGRSAEVYRLSLAGASRDSIERVETLERELATHREYAAQMQRGAQITAAVASPLERYQEKLRELQTLLASGAITQQTFYRALNESQSNLSRLQGGAKNAAFAVQQLAFGAQDAATVYGTTGLAGAIRAASNNVIQFASLINPIAGTIAAVVGVGAALWFDYRDKQQKALAGAKDDLDRYADHARAFVEDLKDLHAGIDRLFDRPQDFRAGEDANRAVQRDQRKNAAALDVRDDELADLLSGVNAPKLYLNRLTSHSADAEQKAAALEQLARHGVEKDQLRAIRKVVEEQEALLRERERLRAQEAEIARSLPGLREDAERQRLAEKREKDAKDADHRAKEQARDAKHAAEEQKRQAQALEHLEEQLTANDDSPKAKGKKITDKLDARKKEIEKLLPGDDHAGERARLTKLAIDSAQRDIERLEKEGQGKGDRERFAGAAARGSSAAISAELSHQAGRSGNPVEKATRDAIVVAREQVRIAKEMLDWQRQAAQVQAATF